MRRITGIILAAILLAALNVSGVFADSSLYDDCADFERIADRSEGVTLDVVTEENKYAFRGDDTHLIRVTSDAEWVIYNIEQAGYFVFNTAFAPSEPVSHFKFEYSSDGAEWSVFNPIISVGSGENGGWIPVTYSLKKLKNIAPDAAMLRVTFGNIDGLPWSPCIESVELRPFTSNEIGFADCVGTEYYGATAKLKNLGLISGYSSTEFEPEGSVTRAEFSKMTARLLNLDNAIAPETVKPVFDDVDSDYWGAGAIYALYGLGIVSGDGEGGFNPEDNVTLSEAVKIIVSSLGYTVLAEDMGGYPSGYMLEASRLNILDGVRETDGAVSRGVAAVLMNNALDVPIVAQTSFGTGGVYEYGSDTILSKYHNIEVLSGVITDIGEATVYAEGGTDIGSFIIDGTSCLCGEFDVMPYFAQDVKAYLRNDGGDHTALYIEQSRGTEVTEIQYNDYERMDPSGLYYTGADGRERRVALKSDTKIIYNYKYMTRAGLLESGMPELKCGFIRAVSCGGSAADYVLVYNFDTYLTSGETRLGGVIADKAFGASDPGFIDADMVMLQNDGETAEYNADYTVGSGTVICAAVSADGSIADIRICADYAFGAVTNAGEDGYTIDGRIYAPSEYFRNSGRTLEPSEQAVTAYLDINGNIVDFIESEGGERYGYLRAAEAGDSFSSSLTLQVITATATAEELTATAKTALNGSASALNVIRDLEPQLIKFSLRGDGTLASIETATELPDGIDSNRFVKNYSSESAKFYDTINIFASKYQLSGGTKVFILPGDTSDISKYEVTNYAALLTDTAYNVQIYDMSDDYKAGAVVIKKNTDDGDVYSYSSVCVIRDSGIYVNADGERCLSLRVYDGGEEKELVISPEGATDRTDGWLPGYTPRVTVGGSNPFSAGEVMQYTESGGRCVGFRMLLTRDVVDTGAHYEHNLGDYGALDAEQFYSELYSAYGIVSRRFSDKLLLCGDTENGYIRTVPLGCPVYVLNMRSGRLYPGSVSDIEQGGSVFAQMRFGTAGAILVVQE